MTANSGDRRLARVTDRSPHGARSTEASTRGRYPARPPAVRVIVPPDIVRLPRRRRVFDVLRSPVARTRRRRIVCARSVAARRLRSMNSSLFILTSACWPSHTPRRQLRIFLVSEFHDRHQAWLCVTIDRKKYAIDMWWLFKSFCSPGHFHQLQFGS